MNVTTSDSDNFWNEIDKRIKSAIETYGNFNKEYKATVTAVAGDGTISVQKVGSDKVYTNVKNYTGVTLGVGDLIYILYVNGDANTIKVDCVIKKAS